MRCLLIVGLVAFFIAVVGFSVCLEAKEKWQGVDETVIEKFAARAGRSRQEPLINTEQGDLPLFLFLVAGTVGGFVGGYCFRMLFHERGRRRDGGGHV